MKFTATALPGVMLVELEAIADDRGFFARTWCAEEFSRNGLNSRLVQCNTSFNLRRATLRGMHFQAAPHEEAKLVRCTRGAIYDAVVDLRRHSPTYLNWVAVEMTESNSRMLYVPEGCAHGFQTLEDRTEVFYQMSEPYHPESAKGVRWDDPSIGIVWPAADVRIISKKDLGYPPLKP